MTDGQHAAKSSVEGGMTFARERGILRRAEGQPGRVLSLLYFSNSLGAAAGTLIAGFVLISWVGLDGTLAVAGMTNLLVAALSVGLAHLQPSLRGEDDASSVGVETQPSRRGPRRTGCYATVVWPRVRHVRSYRSILRGRLDPRTLAGARQPRTRSTMLPPSSSVYSPRRSVIRARAQTPLHDPVALLGRVQP